MKWKVIVAVVVALLLGAGGGALAEHQRLKSDSNKSSSSPKKHTTTTTKPLVDLFATAANRKAACPTLGKFHTAIGNATFDSADHLPWPTQKVKLVAQHAEIAAAYQSLLPVVSSRAKPELEYLIAGEAALRTALTKAATASDFAKAQKPLITARSTKSMGFLLRDATACAKKP
jgi:hypothetical protein